MQCVYDATNDTSVSVRRAAVSAVAPIMNVWHHNCDMLQRAWACILPRLMDNESAVADAALDICNDVIRCILPPVIKADPASSAVAWQQLCAINTQQHYQLSRAVALLCKKGSITRSAVAPILSRIMQHEAGATPPSLLVVAQQLVQAFPLQDGDVLLPQLVSRALALCFADNDGVIEDSTAETEATSAALDKATALREEASLTLQMVAFLADAVPKSTGNQLANALLKVSDDICDDAIGHYSLRCTAKPVANNDMCAGSDSRSSCLRMHRSSGHPSCRSCSSERAKRRVQRLGSALDAVSRGCNGC